MNVARFTLVLAILFCFGVCPVAWASKPVEKSVSAADIESGAVQILGQSGLPMGTPFRGKLSIVKRPGKRDQVQIEIPSLKRTITFDSMFVRCYALNLEDMDIQKYDGKEVVGYEHLSYVLYPVAFWKDRAPLVSPPKDLTPGFQTHLMIRFPEVRPTKAP
ncbi:MAG: hypothetical protein JW818_13160 [Pirellulales bacterium]|nr:hypothetical protein [Pirellulales bacterium]